MAKKIAILTSGGDAPGMNAVVRAAVRTAIDYGFEVLGVDRGYNGLLNNKLIPMDLRSVSGIISHGGTKLLTARSPEYNTPEGVQKAAQTCRDNDIFGVVVCGGDGSFRGARDLANAGIQTIAVPGTIDNDIASSDYTVGFDTAMNTALDIIDKIRDTAESHDRCIVAEVMGRRCGDIALNVGIAAGAIAILVPEVEFDFEKDVIEKINNAKKNGKNSFLVVVAEGVGHVEEIAKKIEAATGVESRASVLGHVQRGGTPTLRDRVMASQFGMEAVKLLNEGKSNRVVVLKDSKIIDLDITEALEQERVFDKDLYEAAKVLAN